MLVTGRKFEQLDSAKPNVEIVEVAGAQKAARPIAAPELVAEPDADENERVA